MVHEDEEIVINGLIISELIKKLSIKQQVVVALRAAGYTQRESGNILGVTRAAIGFSFKRAINILRQEIDDDIAVLPNGSTTPEF